uniref:Uncharacterized protein n=1 Tax=Anopheles atroparvus TaxID=41427 RepID=A0A182IKN9_ANOAO
MLIWSMSGSAVELAPVAAPACVPLQLSIVETAGANRPLVISAVEAVLELDELPLFAGWVRVARLQQLVALIGLQGEQALAFLATGRLLAPPDLYLLDFLLHRQRWDREHAFFDETHANRMVFLSASSRLPGANGSASTVLLILSSRSAARPIFSRSADASERRNITSPSYRLSRMRRYIGMSGSMSPRSRCSRSYSRLMGGRSTRESCISIRFISRCRQCSHTRKLSVSPAGAPPSGSSGLVRALGLTGFGCTMFRASSKLRYSEQPSHMTEPHTRQWCWRRVMPKLFAQLGHSFTSRPSIHGTLLCSWRFLPSGSAGHPSSSLSSRMISLFVSDAYRSRRGLRTALKWSHSQPIACQLPGCSSGLFSDAAAVGQMPDESAPLACGALSLAWLSCGFFFPLLRMPCLAKLKISLSDLSRSCSSECSCSTCTVSRSGVRRSLLQIGHRKPSRISLSLSALCTKLPDPEAAGPSSPIASPNGFAIASTYSEASQRPHKFPSQPSPFCPAPGKEADGKQVVPPDFHTECKSRSEAERDKLRHDTEALLKHVAGLVSAIDPLRKTILPFVGEIGEQLLIHPDRTGTERANELRKRILVAAIETGRLQEAVALYVTSLAGEDWRSIVDRITHSPRRHQVHIEHLITFISMLPARKEQLEYFHRLRGQLVAHKDHESYLGGLFAYRARRVVFAKDGKTALNQTDERELWTTMVAASAGHFKRSLLAGKNVMDWYLLDKWHYDVFEMLLPHVFDVAKEDLRHLDTMKMIEVPCRVNRAHSKVWLFREIISLLQKHFTWSNQNFLYAPWIARNYNNCKYLFGNGTMSKKLMQDSMELFNKFEKGQTYETLLKTSKERSASAQHEQVRVLQLALPQVGEASHRNAVDDAMVGRPAHYHDVRRHDLTGLVEPGQDARLAKTTDRNLGRDYYRVMDFCSMCFTFGTTRPWGVCIATLMLWYAFRMTLSLASSNELFSIGNWSSALEAAFRKNGIYSSTSPFNTRPLRPVAATFARSTLFSMAMRRTAGVASTLPAITSAPPFSATGLASSSELLLLLLLLLPLSSPASSSTSKSSSGLPTSAIPSTSWCSFTILPSYRLVIVTDALSLCTSHRLSNCSTTSPTFTYHSFTVTSLMPSPMSDRWKDTVRSSMGVV